MICEKELSTNLFSFYCSRKDYCSNKQLRLTVKIQSGLLLEAHAYFSRQTLPG